MLFNYPFTKLLIYQILKDVISVLHIGSGNLYGGVERTLLTLALCKNLCPEMEPHFAHCFEGRLSEELRRYHAPHYHLGGARALSPSSVLRVRRSFNSLLSQHPFDCVICHSPWLHAIFGPVARKAGIPEMLWLHDVPDGKHWVQRWAKISAPDFVLCNSRFTQSQLPKLYDGIPSAVAYVPVQRSQEIFTDIDRDMVRRELGAGSQDAVLIQVSRMEPGKGHMALIDALGCMMDAPNWKCWIVGGSQRSKEERYFRALQKTAALRGLNDRILFLGQRDDVPRLLHAADIFVQPNIAPDSFGIAYIEALYAGLPVVTSSIGGGLEVIDEKCGICVPPGNTGALVNALTTLVGSPDIRSTLGEGGPGKAHSLTAPLVCLQNLYEQIRDLSERHRTIRAASSTKQSSMDAKGSPGALRVLHVHAGNLHGGVETTLKLLTLQPDLCPGMDQHLALCFEGRLTREIASAPARVHLLGPVRLSDPISTRRARAALLRLIRSRQFDHAITHSPWGQVVFGPVLKKAGIPTTLWLHDLPDGKHWLQRWARFHVPDFVLCNSRFTQSVLPRLYPQIRATYMYPPVLNGQSYSHGDRSMLRTQLDLPEKKVVIIQVGRMEPVKGHDFLLQALALLGDVPDWICLVVGGAQRKDEQTYLERLRTKTEKLGISHRVRFLGERDDVPRLLAASDIYAQGNAGPETFGITFVEALYAGLPVVTTDLGGAREIVTGDCGILVPAGDEKTFACALKTLILDSGQRFRLGSAAKQRATTLCAPEQQGRRLSEILAAV